MHVTECHMWCPRCDAGREALWGTSFTGTRWHECMTCGYYRVGSPLPLVAGEAA